MLESYRLLRRKRDAIDWLTHLPVERRLQPEINIVLALWDRDDGKEQEARQFLGTSAFKFPGLPVAHAVNEPLSQWPSDLASMTADPTVELRIQ